MSDIVFFLFPFKFREQHLKLLLEGWSFTRLCLKRAVNIPHTISLHFDIVHQTGTIQKKYKTLVQTAR